jgi:hypothetical protein
MRWFLVALLAMLLAAPAAQAQQETVTISVNRVVERVDEDTVRVTATVTCTSGGEVLEAFLYVVQRQGSQFLNSEFAFFSPICDGTPHTFTVTVEAGEGQTFRRGRASVSSFVLLTSGASTSPSDPVIIR